MHTENALVAQICHDLISPLNAVNLGLEAFEESHDNELLEGIKQSVAKANIILKFTRELHAEKSSTFCYSAKSLTKTISSFLNIFNIQFKLTIEFESIPDIAGKIIMLTAMVAKENMPYGGEITCTINDESGEIITIYSGRNISIPDIKSSNEINSRNITRFRLIKILQDSGFSITFEETANGITICEKLV